ncbi:hypothetical protein [Thiocapsa marina]|uniref:Lipoprotein n=1 Tax=Thiocapsa marina 5811 TaxID=768671 RepID=F9UC50_9GAMM|nr:hypothetical protein [Thiocapsa marina]EGV17963.1 hypothetical protein ThimaDRAFT_2502 [Thiocapsa marina 5811]
MTAARRSYLLLAGAALIGHFPAHAAQPAISAAEIDAFLQKCTFIDIPYEASERLQGVSIRGMTPIHYIAASSGEGDVWGFEFKLSVAEFKRRAPDLAGRVDMPIPVDEREYVVALYRVLEEPSHESEPLRLVCRSEAIEGDDEP